MSRIFPKSANRLPLQIVIFAAVVVSVVTAATAYYATPKYTRVGYAPVQPVPFSHAKHVSELGIDCRYCHNNVEKSEHATVPTSQTCMNCHSQIKTSSPLLAPVRASYASGDPVPWVKVHQTPDYVYFNHSVHVNRGVSCYVCHGDVNNMDTITHRQPLSMGFCISCHRDPAPNLRPLDQIYNLNWKPSDMPDHDKWAANFVLKNNIRPPQACSGCHR